MIIKGNTTFADLIDWGISEQEIESITHESIEAKNGTIRDFASKQDVEFSTFKTSFQNLLDLL